MIILKATKNQGFNVSLENARGRFRRWHRPLDKILSIKREKFENADRNILPKTYSF